MSNSIGDRNDIIRLCNGYDVICARDWCFVGVSETFDVFDVNLFTKNLFKVMKHAIIFNLVVSEINNRLYWVKKPLNTINLEVCSPEKHEANGVSFKSIEFVSGGPLYKFIYSTNNKESKLTALFSHALFDGAGVLKFFTIIRKVVEITMEQTKAEKPEVVESQFNVDNMLAPLIDMVKDRDHEFSMEFDARKWMFTGITEEEYNGIPKYWVGVGKIPMNPPTPKDGWLVANTVTKNYSPMKKYCIKHSVTPQAILMVIRARACRKLMKLDNSYPLTFTAPVVTRFTKFATPVLKNSMFFSAASLLFTKILGKDSIDDEIQECYNNLKIANEDPTSCVIIGKISRNVNEKTLELSNNTSDMPDGNTSSIVSATHSGRFESSIGRCTQLSVCGRCQKGDPYAITLYGYHDNDTFMYTMITPDTIGREIIDSVFEQVDIMQEHFIADQLK